MSYPLIHGTHHYCPACDKAFEPKGYKTHARSKSHIAKLLAHDNRTFKIIANAIVFLGGKIVSFKPADYADSSLAMYVGADQYELSIETLYGALRIIPNRRAFIHTRFAEAERAKPVIGHSYSGKWNFHFDDDGLNPEDLSHFFRALARVLPGTDPMFALKAAQEATP